MELVSLYMLPVGGTTLSVFGNIRESLSVVRLSTLPEHVLRQREDLVWYQPLFPGGYTF